MNKLRLVLATAAALMTLTGVAQVQLVEGNKPLSRIFVTTNTKEDSIAASLLQNFVQKTTQAELPILAYSKTRKIRKGDVFIGNGLPNASFQTKQLREDGFLVSTQDGYLRILSGGDGGSIYGVVTLLEDYLGVQYWGESEYSLNLSDNAIIPALYRIENPTFTHRQTQFYGFRNDPNYKYFRRFESIDELFAGRYWVHTFSRLVPLATYGKSHPEYFAYINGMRRPKPDAQLCLTNPDVLEIVAHQVDSIFKANPEQNMVSVSQLDGDQTWCQCDECTRIMEEEGSVSGPYIHFLNKLATRFPNKQLSTLAYIFTVKPPKHVKPLPNVNILLCVNSTRESTIDVNVTGSQFLKSLEGWSKISNNLFIWDYGINFHNYPAPFPNFHILAKNMQIFHENHVRMQFSQTSPEIGSDFAEMRAWLISKLMWNPYMDTDELILEFVNGYYGKHSAPYIYQYIKLMQGALLASNLPLWIYDTPVTFKESMLNRALMKQYNALFNKAEQAARNDSTYLARIQRTRISLMFSELEIARTDPKRDVKELGEKLEYFEKKCKEFKIDLLSEKRTYLADFCKFYRERYLTSFTDNLAAAAKVTYLIKPHDRYHTISSKALTDGLYGGQTFNRSWVGWEGTDGNLIIDLGEEKEFTHIVTDFMLAPGDWIWPPKNVIYSVSSDGKNFKKVGIDKLAEQTFSGSFVPIKHQFNQALKARYIQIYVDALKIRPAAGDPCWFFIDEVMVFNRK